MLFLMLLPLNAPPAISAGQTADHKPDGNGLIVRSSAKIPSLPTVLTRIAFNRSSPAIFPELTVLVNRDVEASRFIHVPLISAFFAVIPARPVSGKCGEPPL